MERDEDRPGAGARNGGGSQGGGEASYVYAVVEVRDVPIPEMLPCAGVIGAPVYAVASQGLAAIVSPVAPEVFSAEALEAKLHELTWVAANAMAHQEVLAWLLTRRYTIAPVRFGTLCSDPDHVRTVLTRHAQHFVQTLGRVEGATEWGLKLSCDGHAVAEWAKSRNVQAGRMTGGVVGMSEGAAYFAHKQLEQRVRKETAHLLGAHARDLHTRLSSVARAAVTHPVPAGGVRRDGPTVLLHAAYLVADASVEAFHAAVCTKPGPGAPPGITCETTGPWPPYNFVNTVLEELG